MSDRPSLLHRLFRADAGSGGGVSFPACVLNGALVVAVLSALFYLAFRSVEYHWSWEVAWGYRAKFLAGWIRTLHISAASLLCSILIGVVAALAPRAFFSSSPLRDSNFDVRGVKKAIPKAREVYQLLGQGEALQLRTPDCEHDFPPEIRQEAYHFIDQALVQAEDHNDQETPN